MRAGETERPGGRDFCGLSSMRFPVPDQIDGGQRDQSGGELDDGIAEEDGPDHGGLEQSAEGDPGKEQAVQRDADRIADQYPRLCFFFLPMDNPTLFHLPYTHIEDRKSVV